MHSSYMAFMAAGHLSWNSPFLTIPDQVKPTLLQQGEVRRGTQRAVQSRCCSGGSHDAACRPRRNIPNVVGGP